MSGQWTSTAAGYERRWAGRAWHLGVGGPRTGLVSGDRLGPLLAVDGISDRRRPVPTPVAGPSLVGRETLFDRVEALYAPEGWGTLRVRASWSPRGGNGMDLEVQVQAFTVGDLEEVEVHVASRFDPFDVEELPGLDAGHLARLRAAGSTLPLRGDDAFPPSLATVAAPGGPPAYYLEMVHPDDGRRRVLDRASGEIRYALLGHDLERGVIVRGRLRGLWLDHRPDAAEVARHIDEFLGEPPPLGS